jgi:hypothetical protein
MRRILLAVILVAALLAAGCTKEAPQTGSLEITSTPSDVEVQVVLDGNFQGVTPLLLTNLSAGSHLLQLRSPDYQDKVQLVTITAGQKMIIAADYPPNPTPAPVTPIPLPTPEPTAMPTEKPTEVPVTPVPPGSLYVTSFPAGATIYLDGKGYGITPKLIGGLAPGSYELRLSLVGWKDYRVVISVSPGLTHREDAVLRS